MSKVQCFIDSEPQTVYDEAMGVWRPTVYFHRVVLETDADFDTGRMLDALHAAIAVLSGGGDMGHAFELAERERRDA